MRALALWLLLAAAAVAGPLGPSTVDVRFEVYPPDAEVEIVMGGRRSGAPRLRADKPVPVPEALAANGFEARFYHEGFEEHHEQVLPSAAVTGRWPAKGRISLQPVSAAAGVRYWVQYHPLTAGGGVAAALAVAGFVGVQVRSRRVAQARLARLDELRARADLADPLVANLTVLGGFRLVQRLGAGGMATVYRALPDDTLDDRSAVAVKVMQQELAANEEFRLRFQREYRVLARLSHPLVLRILSFGEQEGLLYLVSEFVEGGTLKARLGRPLSPAEALSLLDPLMEGLEYAHAQGVVHRDLKPDNVMITPSGRLKIMDFGLARAEDLTSYTVTGAALGTPAYMAPEQVSGGSLSSATDQYAVGVMAYEMLAGRRPFEEADPLAMAMRHLDTAPPPLGGPPAVEAVVMRMLAKDPVQRFASVALARAAFREAVAAPVVPVASDDTLSF